KYGQGKLKEDWRRENVNLLIKSLSARIKSIKPWVRFGVSPFGIWRNKKTDSRGSDTNGLENYDALYADVLLWTDKGWIDYLIPQIYWERENQYASYDILLDWWNDNSNGRHIYIGQHTEVTMNKPDIEDKNQLKSKIDMSREAANVAGSCWWSGYSVTNNYGGVADSLKAIHHSTVALPPSYPWLSSTQPEAPYDLNVTEGNLNWSTNQSEGTISDCVRFVVYRFDNDDSLDLEEAANIVGVTNANHMEINEPGYYVVTALDRVNNESFPSEPVYIK
ncbi:MAG: family 10 glycosylhydrolase, partial [Muribaculaceae bacterium]|nr:family 10 glycosylhydrolase [Muribaculaceae bacterium]